MLLLLIPWSQRCTQIRRKLSIHTILHILQKRIEEHMEIVTPIVVYHLNIVSPEYCSDRSSLQLIPQQLLFPPEEINMPGYAT